MLLFFVVVTSASGFSQQQQQQPFAGGGQFGGRSGCCVKADAYLDGLSQRPAEPSESNSFHKDWVNLLDQSLRRSHGSSLPDALSLASDDDLVCVSHDTTPGNPIFNYASRAALELFEMTWDQFVATPSRFSAEPVDRAERTKLLDAVEKRGFVDKYSGVRISRTGRRFAIKDAVVWNVIDENGALLGQAALFKKSLVEYL